MDKQEKDLSHFGIPGMRWGIRRELDSQGRPISNFKQLRKSDGKLKVSHTPAYAKIAFEALPTDIKATLIKLGVGTIAVPTITKIGPKIIKSGFNLSKKILKSGVLTKPFKSLAKSMAVYNGKLTVDWYLNRKR